MAVMPLGRTEESQDGKNLKYKLVTGPPVGSRCQFCGRPYHLGGPFWLAPIHDRVFLSELIESLEEEKFGTYERMRGMLTVASMQTFFYLWTFSQAKCPSCILFSDEELHDVPFYYSQDRLCSMTRTSCGKLVTFRSALLNAGYRVSLSHANKHALKSDAPNEFIWDMMRAWEKKNPVNREKLAKDSVAWAILDKQGERVAEVDFTTHADANPESRAMQLKRFQQNPERNWGPKTRAAQGTFGDDQKRIQNQGKKRKRQQQKDEDSRKDKRVTQDSRKEEAVCDN